MKPFILLSSAEQQLLLTSLGQPAFRAKQISRWIFERRVTDWSKMTDLPASLRTVLSDEGRRTVPAEIVGALASGWATKYAIRLDDGEVVESVAMKYDYGTSVCVSTQAGCKMACAFCASAEGGYIRNLSSWEMLSQVILAGKDSEGRANTHVVLMGMGEPLDNYAEVITFVHALREHLGISPRRVTLSTCGLVPQMQRLAAEGLPLTLSVSLHAADDITRSKIMPINQTYPVADVLAAMHDYSRTTGRRVSIEYTLISGINDSPEAARQLAEMVKGHFHVNLIPVNPVEGMGWEAPGAARVEAFRKALESKGVNATIRRGLGLEIDGSCGQLRRRTPRTTK
jgi:23S rRNA (adenine2503-C2)-methyltransferase